MTELLTAAQMRAIEQAAIESGEVTGLELMERAGQGVVEAIFEEWPELADGDRRAVVLCGPGNNGGDGFVVARLLKERGWDVSVFLYGDADKLPQDAKANCERWKTLGDVRPIEDFQRPIGWTASIYIDAVFGTGLSRPLGDLHNELWETFDADAGLPRLVAVDTPSGMCSDSGFALRDGSKERLPAPLPNLVFEAQLTVAFHSPKIGHYLSEGEASCGKVIVKGIGLPRRNNIGPKGKGVVKLASPIIRGKRGVNHKYGHGHALVLSGSHGNTGAARLAARGALRIGAGLVTLGSPRSAMLENACNLTAVMLRQIDGALGLTELLEDSRFNAICLGPGLGIRADTQAMVFTALKAERPTVLDADALSRFRTKPEALFDALHKDCVLTPHGGEFARLFPDLAEKLDAPATTGPAYSKVDATREAAERAGCVVLFKGADTVIANPDGRCSINSALYDRAAPWLATAGSGDVLAGFIAGLLARGFAPMQAAETGAWLHVECARKFGPGLIAEDLAEQLPTVFRELGL
ncbi:bifunctional ADP-dependent NAD(P)H-hydrate dehydratase/NAD(P)H-hydrate epimerase [Sedimentitalea sp. CY04]|uniref:Bifunctional NAD(P)H-hydrate repair enzyme n=1 Tax=Parasedimentitalea denitrificans TaxID=2211118 RepID=A0ABX0W6H2_9RHOB|nr:NAD(P)H-hydrate dehydratase [Sedimentitalea sp. CY04]NIZ61255.1 bifunctional ADP-dependent NAD(P)H-hydrate dehydratase/NAD(P)H-hydrate epimerase [Sedimentitalea sp. CY04]